MLRALVSILSVKAFSVPAICSARITAQSLSEETNNDTYENLSNEEIYNELLKVDKDIIIDKNNFLIQTLIL